MKAQAKIQIVSLAVIFIALWLTNVSLQPQATGKAATATSHFAAYDVRYTAPNAPEIKWSSNHYCNTPSVNWHELPDNAKRRVSHHYSPCAPKVAKNALPVSSVTILDTKDETPTFTPPVVEHKAKCNNGFGNGPDTACKTHGKAANQDNRGASPQEAGTSNKGNKKGK